jgi:multidrug efflux pump subunit AcrA (membrane-fusion protein)
LPDGLLSGQTGEATFIAGEHTNALLVPITAVDSVANKRGSVFVFKNGILEKRPVSIGYITITTVEILDGLREGEQVVSKDVDQQRDGDRVKIKTK